MTTTGFKFIQEIGASTLGFESTSYGTLTFEESREMALKMVSFLKKQYRISVIKTHLSQLEEEIKGAKI